MIGKMLTDGEDGMENIAGVCFIFSYLQFNEKGFLFNNAYIYASVDMVFKKV